MARRFVAIPPATRRPAQGLRRTHVLKNTLRMTSRGSRGASSDPQPAVPVHSRTADGEDPVDGTGIALRVQDLSKVYSGDVHALSGVSLTIGNGEFVTLLGPSGSGKTTLLMTIAGFVYPTAGRVFSESGDITRTPPQRRNFGMVFQSYALFPHMTVRRNVAYPLSVRAIRGKQRAALADEALALVDLDGLGDRKPAQLSGGQQQRVALARALVYKPSVLLLDEPLGALDRALRERMQIELRHLHQKLGVTFVYVTHDQDEALRMSDRVVVLRAGAIEQVGSPVEIYRRPVNEFVAKFVGEANLLAIDIVGPGSSPDRVSCRLRTGEVIEAPRRHDVDLSGMQGSLLVRPEQVRIAEVGDDAPSLDGTGAVVEVRGVLSDVSFSGTTWRYDVATSYGEIRSAMHMKDAAQGGQVGDEVRVTWNVAESRTVAG